MRYVTILPFVQSYNNNICKKEDSLPSISSVFLCSFYVLNSLPFTFFILIYLFILTFSFYSYLLLLSPYFFLVSSSSLFYSTFDLTFSFNFWPYFILTSFFFLYQQIRPSSLLSTLNISNFFVIIFFFFSINSLGIQDFVLLSVIN